MPYYQVNSGSEAHLVKAKTPASAIRHVMDGKITATLLSNDELASMLVGGAKLQDATIEPTPSE